MQNSVSYEYTYANSKPTHHHQYLSKPILHSIQTALTKAQSVDFISREKSKVKVLDLGCGNGSFSNLLATQGFEVTGIEESASGIAQAQQAYPKCRFIQGNIYALDLTDLYQSFDIVLSAEVIEHLFYPKELVRVARQCLYPGGSLILTTPYHGYFKNLALALTGKMDTHFTAL